MLKFKSPRSSKSERNKRNMLVQALHRKGTASRLHLARALHISNSRVCDLVEQMISEGLLAEEGVGKDRRGRRGVSVRINPAYGQLIGFDMEAKRLRLVVTDFAGQIVWQTRKSLRPARSRRRCRPPPPWPRPRSTRFARGCSLSLTSRARQPCWPGEWGFPGSR